MRSEFAKPTKRAALRRAKGLCEACGLAYGFKRGQRCNAPLSYGVEFDHYPIRAADGGSSALENCVAVCIRCHRWKTHKIDLPEIAKGKRVADKFSGVSKAKSSFPTSRDGRYKRRLDGRTVTRQRERSPGSEL